MAGGMSVKEWVVIHKIKALHDNGKGLSIRAISQALACPAIRFASICGWTSRRSAIDWKIPHAPSDSMITGITARIRRSAELERYVI